MKTKPIIKEIEKEWKKLIWDKDYPELWKAFEDYLDMGILEAVEEILQKRVEWLIKQIDRQIDAASFETILLEDEGKRLAVAWWSGYTEALSDVIKVIKKAFEGVVE